MRLSVSTFVYFNYPLAEAMKRIARCGYDGVEVWGGRPHAYRKDLSQGQIQALRDLVVKEGIAVSGFIPAQFRYPTNLCIANERIRQDSIAYLKDSIETAEALGAPLVSLCPGHSLYGQSKEDAWERLKDSLRALSAFASQRGVRLVVEPADKYETDLVQTTDDVLRLLEESGLGDMGVVLDTGHAYMAGEELPQVVKRLGEALYHVHIGDNHGQRDEHLIPGQGTIDFAPFITALREVGYEGYLVAELAFGYILDPDSSIREALERMKEFIAY